MFVLLFSSANRNLRDERRGLSSVPNDHPSTFWQESVLLNFRERATELALVANADRQTDRIQLNLRLKELSLTS